MEIKIFSARPFATNAYVVSSSSKEAVIIDPGLGISDLVSAYIDEKQLQLLAILLTHSHWDHIGSAAELKRRYGVPLWVHADDAPNVKEPGSDGLPLMLPIERAAVDAYFEDGQKIRFGPLEFEVIHTPGHSPGGVCLFAEKEKVLFSGDTLFRGTIGNLSFSTGEPEKMWSSLKRLSKLPKETKVYPGHGNATTIGEEEWLADAKSVFEKS